MGKEFASWSLLFHLLFLMCAHGRIGATEMNEKHSTLQKIIDQNNVLRLSSKRDGNGHHMMHGGHVYTHPSSMMHHMDPAIKKFFTVKDLKVGKTTTVSLPKLDPNPPHFLPREIAESIPFSSEDLPHLFKLFSIPQDSHLAKEMEETLGSCESKPIRGEIKHCATSLESLLDFVRSIFGKESHFHALTTRHLTESKTAVQNYTIYEMPKELPVSRIVPCHPLTYPYAIFACHSVDQTNVFMVPLEGDNGDRIEALVACHFDTSEWYPNHEAFRVLEMKPGASDVCHFFPADHLIWVTHGTGAREMNDKYFLEELMARNDDRKDVLRLHGMKDDNDKHEVKQENDGFQMTHSQHIHANPSSHMHDRDHLLSIFFTMKDLKFGKIIPLYFKNLDPTSPQFLPREIAGSIPFSSKELPHLLKLFSLSQGSPLAKDMEQTLGMCEAKPIKGEVKFCATSFESLLDSVRNIFGTESHFHALTTQLSTMSKTNIYQNYTIRAEPNEMTAHQMVPCHPLPYPYVVFYCHWVNQTKTFKVLLEGENGDKIEALASCHMDTSEWDPRHVSFQVLRTKPGSSEVCHFFPASNLVWVPRMHV